MHSTSVSLGNCKQKNLHDNNEFFALKRTANAGRGIEDELSLPTKYSYEKPNIFSNTSQDATDFHTPALHMQDI
jgi:hypothetical protein